MVAERGQHPQAMKGGKAPKGVEECTPLNIIWVESSILGGSVDSLARLTIQGLPNNPTSGCWVHPTDRGDGKGVTRLLSAEVDAGLCRKWTVGAQPRGQVRWR